MESATTSLPLRLRTISPDDAVAITRLLEGDTELALQTATIPIPYTIESARAFLAAADPLRIFAIAVGDELVGTIGMIGAAGMMGPQPPPGQTSLNEPPDEHSDEFVEVGYWIGRVHWGRGYATAALRLLVELAQRRGIPRLDAYAYPHNAASLRVLERNGFVRLGEVQRNLPQRGGLRTLLHFQRDL
jgi:RimJ/RimL family protein N-acetyltransferase